MASHNNHNTNNNNNNNRKRKNVDCLHFGAYPSPWQIFVYIFGNWCCSPTIVCSVLNFKFATHRNEICDYKYLKRSATLTKKKIFPFLLFPPFNYLFSTCLKFDRQKNCFSMDKQTSLAGSSSLMSGPVKRENPYCSEQTYNNLAWLYEKKNPHKSALNSA